MHPVILHALLRGAAHDPDHISQPLRLPHEYLRQTAHQAVVLRIRSRHFELRSKVCPDHDSHRTPFLRVLL